ncbi:MAG: Holin family protein [Firmicutes bacterium ADurb.Bin193]|nr:MAG: Holin family protein [Firmicutes bacterium ADurb.Bin193]
MDKLSFVLKWFGASITALTTYLFGGVDLALGILLALITIDYATGVISAIINKELSSEIGGRGIAKKVGTLIVVALAHLIGTYLGFEVRAWVIGYYIANEGISIIENTGRMGVPYPDRLMQILKQLKKGDNDENS